MGPPSRIAALQPYWRPASERGGLSEEDRRALDSDMMPPSALAAGRRSAALTGRIALGVAGFGLIVAAVGVAALVVTGNPAGAAGLPILLGGGLLGLGLLFALGSLVTQRQYRPAPLHRIVDAVVDVRRVQRLLGHGTRQLRPYEVLLAQGTALDVPLTADALAESLTIGATYRFWYLPAPNQFTYHTVIYVEEVPRALVAART